MVPILVPPKPYKTLNPLILLGYRGYLAEGQGFEPWIGYKPMPVFKTGAFNRSATPPSKAEYTR